MSPLDPARSSSSSCTCDWLDPLLFTHTSLDPLLLHHYSLTMSIPKTQTAVVSTYSPFSLFLRSWSSSL